MSSNVSSQIFVVSTFLSTCLGLAGQRAHHTCGYTDMVIYTYIDLYMQGIDGVAIECKYLHPALPPAHLIIITLTCTVLLSSTTYLIFTIFYTCQYLILFPSANFLTIMINLNLFYKQNNC